MLHDLSQDLKNGLCEEFCKQIHIPDASKGKEMHVALIQLPNNPAYSHYFDVREYYRITAYDADLHRREVKILSTIKL